MSQAGEAAIKVPVTVSPASPAGEENAGKLVQADTGTLVLLKIQQIPGPVLGRLMKTLDDVEVPIGPVNDIAEVLSDPHVRARQLVGSFDYPGVGEFKALASPYKFRGWDKPSDHVPVYVDLDIGGR